MSEEKKYLTFKSRHLQAIKRGPEQNKGISEQATLMENVETMDLVICSVFEARDLRELFK